MGRTRMDLRCPTHQADYPEMWYKPHRRCDACRALRDADRVARHNARVAQAVASGLVPPSTHEQLVKAGVNWCLSNGCNLVAWEAQAGIVRCDVLGLMPYARTVHIECKASRSDFLADKHKGSFPDQVGTMRYYLVSVGIVRTQELPDHVGLLELRGERVYRVREASAEGREDDRRVRKALEAINNAAWDNRILTRGERYGRS